MSNYQKYKESSIQSRKRYAESDAGKETGKKARHKHREQRRQWFFEYKSNLSCVYCGLSNPLCLDMDHVDPSTKKGTPSTMVTNGTSWKLVLEELEKCQPVCRNCHQIKTVLQNNKLRNQDFEQFVPKSLSCYHICEREHES